VTQSTKHHCPDSFGEATPPLRTEVTKQKTDNAKNKLEKSAKKWKKKKKKTIRMFADDWDVRHNLCCQD